jgi:hypothetical protein
MSKSRTKSTIGVMATNLWESCTHHPPTRQVVLRRTGGGAADVGGVIGQQTRDTDYTRFTGGAISAERLETAAAAGTPDNSPNRLCIVDSGAGTSTGPASLTGNGWRPATTEYCTDVVWLGKDDRVRVQAAQGKAVRATIRAKWIMEWAPSRRVDAASKGQLGN